MEVIIMQFGMSALIELKSTEACAALYREMGLSFAALSMDLPDYQADKLNVGDKNFYTIYLEGDWMKARSWI